MSKSIKSDRKYGSGLRVIYSQYHGEFQCYGLHLEGADFAPTLREAAQKLRDRLVAIRDDLENEVALYGESQR